MNGLATR